MSPTPTQTIANLPFIVWTLLEIFWQFALTSNGARTIGNSTRVLTASRVSRSLRIRR